MRRQTASVSNGISEEGADGGVVRDPLVFGSGESVEIESIAYQFSNQEVLHGVSLAFEAGKLTTVLGPSGSGKTTLLRIIAGLLQPSRGTVAVAGKSVTSLAPHKRGIGFVFQNYALFPHMSVNNNVEYPLRLRKWDKQRRKESVRRSLSIVGLEGFGERFPAELSGGQQQRVAVARAIVFRPPVLLMDEPLGSLDKGLRQQLQVEIRDLQRRLGITTISVTHDQDEAFSMSDKIIVMQDGNVCQSGTPREVYNSPNSRFVADFVGALNHFDAEVRELRSQDAYVETVKGSRLVVPVGNLSIGDKVVVGIRPERITLDRTQPAARHCQRGRITTVAFGGSRSFVEVGLTSGESLRAEIGNQTSAFEAGEEVWISWPEESVLVFVA